MLTSSDFYSLCSQVCSTFLFLHKDERCRFYACLTCKTEVVLASVLNFQLFFHLCRLRVSLAQFIKLKKSEAKLKRNEFYARLVTSFIWFKLVRLSFNEWQEGKVEFFFLYFYFDFDKIILASMQLVSKVNRRDSQFLT